MTLAAAADAWARRSARALLSNRAGHGGTKDRGVGYRQMTEAQLAGLGRLAFEAGVQWARENPGA